MSHTIDLTKIEGAQLSSEGNASDLAYLKANGPRALPDSPTANGWSADAIKKQFYKQSEILFAWLKRLAESTLDLGEKTNASIAALENGSAFPLIYASLAEAQADYAGGKINEGALVLTSDGTDLSVYYCADGGLTILGESFSTFLARIESNETEIAKIKSGAVVAKNAEFAQKDAQGNVITDAYGASLSHGLQGASDKWTFTVSLLNKLGSVIDTETQVFGGATSSVAGLMTAEDKAHLDALYSVFGSTSDSDTLVNTVTEVLAVFAQYPEGVTIANALASKLDAADVVDNLTTNDGSKALSAKQGKNLKDALDAVADDLDTAEGNIADLETEVAKKITKGAGVFDNTLGAGYADAAKSIQTSVGRDDETPFAFQTTGGSADVDTGFQELRKLVGVSVVRNQQIENGDFSNGTTGWRSGSGSYSLSASSNKLTATVLEANTSGDVRTTKRIAPIKGHKYLLTVTATCSETTDMRVAVDNSGFYLQNTPISLTANTRKTYFLIIDYNGNSELSYIIFYGKMTDGGLQVGTTLVLENVYLFDLTQTYGNNTVVNAILGNTVSDYVKRLLKFDPNLLKQVAFNAGTFVDSQSAKQKSVGRNAFDGEWKVGYYYGPNAEWVSETRRTSFAHLIRVNGGESYTLETNGVTAESMYLRQYDINKKECATYTYYYGLHTRQITLAPQTVYVGIFYEADSGSTVILNNAKVCFYLTWDGSQTGFIDHESQTYDLPNIVQRGIFKVDASGNIYADGDVAYPDGTGGTNYTLIDLGDLKYGTPDANGWTRSASETPLANPEMPSSTLVEANCASTKWPRANAEIVYANDGYIGIETHGRVAIRDPMFIGKTAAEVKALVSGIKFIYKTATPTPITFDPFPENVWADDFGTTQFLDSDGNEIVGLQGAEFFYEANIAGFGESIYAKTGGDPEKIVYEEELAPIAARIPECPTSTDGTYVLKCTVSNGVATYAWVAE